MTAALQILLLLICGTAAVTAAVAFHNYRRRVRHEIEVLRTENRLMEEYYESLNIQITEMREFRHDLANYLGVCEAMQHADVSPGKMNAYNRQLREKCEKMKLAAYCDDPIMNAVLANKARVCAEAGIRTDFSMQEYHRYLVRDVDLVTIAANLLDNAIEGCRRNTGIKEHWIRVSAGSMSGYTALRVENDTNLTSFDTKHYKTVKKDGEKHGIGLRAIQEVVDYYGGNMDIQVGGGVFDAMVQIKVPENLHFQHEI